MKTDAERRRSASLRLAKPAGAEDAGTQPLSAPPVPTSRVLIVGVLIAGVWLLSPAQAVAEIIHVSPMGTADGSGTAEDPVDLFTGSARVEAGDVVVLADGVYEGYLEPGSSGTAEAPITFRAAENAQPVITGDATALYLVDRHHLVFEGLRLHDVHYWIEGAGSHDITLRDCIFTAGRAYPACDFERGDRIHVVGSYFDGGEDSLHIAGGGFHLIEGNTFVRASHECLSLTGVHDTVVRNNYFSNPIQKLVDLTGNLEDEWSGPVRPAERVVIEGNYFALSAGEDTSFAGIQLASNDVIIRRNVFANLGYGVDISSWDDPSASECLRAHIYNNTFYSNGDLPGGVTLFFSHYDASAAYGGHVIMNNLFVDNVSHLAEDGILPSTQIALGWNARPEHFRLMGNVFEASDAAILGVVSDAATVSLEAFAMFDGATVGDNALVTNALLSASSGRFSLSDESPAVDAGLALTHATSAGEGREIPVGDVGFFSAGFGLVEGDRIRVGEQEATVLEVDLERSTLAVDRALSWEEGSPVSFPYAGEAPDVGAFELGEELHVAAIATPSALPTRAEDEKGIGCHATRSRGGPWWLLGLGFVTLRRRTATQTRRPTLRQEDWVAAVRGWNTRLTSPGGAGRPGRSAPR